jgi:signal transduction histidine kinase
MLGWPRGLSLHPAAEASVALVASAALFLLIAALPIRGHVAPIVAAGAAFIALVVWAARRRGPLYAVPLAIAGGLAFDSFLIPPVRDFGAGDWQNWLVMAVYVTVGVLIGVLGAESQRRAQASDEARGEIAREQAALRRMATLVARGIPADAVFDAVTEEVGRLLRADLAGLVRFRDGMQSPVSRWAASGEHPHIGGRWPLDGGDPAAIVARTGRSARIDDYTGASGEIAAFIRERLRISSTVAGPIVVEGELWGALGVHATRGKMLPPDAEARLAKFTELVATSISNANARAEIAHLAEQQSALRRVAVLVARELPRAAVFAAIAEELGQIAGVEHVRMWRFEEDGTATAVASSGAFESAMPVGAREPLDGESISARIWRTGRTARIDGATKIRGRLSPSALELGVRSAVGVPILVEGRPWGAMVAVSRRPKPLPPDTEVRVGEFTELMATAIANLHARSELDASRARMVAAADQERHRVVRDLHDGAQQRLVHTVVTLKLAQRALDIGDGSLRPLMAEALEHANEANAELRELAHGILPAALTRGGLRAGIDALVSRMDLPVTVEIAGARYPSGVEASAYFVVAEALTNILKHARAGHAHVRTSEDEGELRLEVRDDGVGGASAEGPGLVGVEDRVSALGGRLRIVSPAGEGTLVEATLPLPG